MRSYITIILLIFIIGLSFTSCENDEQQCYETIDIKTNLSFSQRTAEDSTFTLPPDSTLVDSIYISYRDTFLPAARMQAMDVANPLYFNAYNNNKVSVSLNPDTVSMRYQLQFDTTIAAYDTITLFYRPNLHFISNACGYTYFYTIDSIHFTGNGLDSLTIPNRNVTSTASTVNMIFYFFP